MDKKVFQPVGSKSSEHGRYQFEDSSSKLYSFVGEHSTRGNDEQSDSEEEMEGRDEICEHVGDCDDSMSHTTPEHIRYVTFFFLSLQSFL